MFKLSLPTKDQISKAASRVAGVFVVACLAYLKVHHGDGFSYATAHALWLAGSTAVYQLAESFLTTL